MSGFNVEECYLKNNRNDIVVVAKKRHPRDLDGKKEKMAEIVKSLHRKVEDLTRMGKKVSIWGAGHRALALMALSDVDKINFVIEKFNTLSASLNSSFAISNLLYKSLAIPTD